METRPDFNDNLEAEAFERYVAQPEAAPGESIRARMEGAWMAARDYFTQDRAETVTEGGINPGYFDERRAMIRLEILKGCHGSSGEIIIENAKSIEAWVFGE